MISPRMVYESKEYMRISWGSNQVSNPYALHFRLTNLLRLLGVRGGRFSPYTDKKENIRKPRPRK